MEALAFEYLVQALHQQLAALPDYRRGKRIPSTRSKMPPWERLPSSLPSHPPFWPISGRCNTLKGGATPRHSSGVRDMPCDNQIRTWR